MENHSLHYTVHSTKDYVFLRDVLKRYWGISHALLTRLKAHHKIKVNGRVTRTNYQLQEGDFVSVDIDLEEHNTILPQDMPLDVVYEDHDYLVVNKPPDLPVHPNKDVTRRTLANAVSYYLSQNGSSALFRPINRLDKDTSGLILIGKSQYAHQAVFSQQKQGMVRRSYQAMVEGLIHEDQGTIEWPIAHLDPQCPKRMVHPTGKPALTRYEVAARYEGYTLLSLTLGTGRTHQIRVHLSHAGHPVCGDILYGTASPLIKRQALHACQLSFTQPRTGSPLAFHVPWPHDITDLIEHLIPLKPSI